MDSKLPPPPHLWYLIFICLRCIIHVKWHNKIGNGITPTRGTVLAWSQIVLCVHMPIKHFCNTKWMIHIHLPSHTLTQRSVLHIMTLQFFPKQVLFQTHTFNDTYKYLIFKNSFPYHFYIINISKFSLYKVSNANIHISCLTTNLVLKAKISRSM